MSENTERPEIIFILGIMPRTGTHFLANLLCKHPDCTKGIVPEDCLIIHSLSLTNYAQQSYKSWTRDAELPGGLPLREMMLESLGNGLKDFLWRARSEFAGKLRAEHPGSSVLAKTPRFLVTKTPQVINAHNFFKLFPHNRPLIIVRDGRNLVQSLVFFANCSEEEAIQEWARAADTVIACEKRWKTQAKPYLIIKYEELHSDTEAQMHRILDFLGLDKDAYNFESIDQLPVVGSSVFKRGTGPVHWNPVVKTKDFDPLSRSANWTRKQHERFNWLAGRQMAYFGYRLVEFEGNRWFWTTRNRLLDLKWGILTWWRRGVKILAFMIIKLRRRLRENKGGLLPGEQPVRKPV